MLDKRQQDHFQAHGYAVFPSLFNEQQINELRNEALKIVDDFDPESTRSVFSTQTETDKNRDQYFLSSDDKVRCFFEEEAFCEEGKLKQPKQLSINKIGHALHTLNPVFRNFAQLPIIAQIAQALGVSQPQIRQSMYIFKQPKIGGVIRWHQDATYFFTQPQSVLTLWFAIEDATIENGCLQIDKLGARFPLKEQFKRFEDDSTSLETLDDIDWPSHDRALPLEVKAGTLVAFSGVLPHFSEANRSANSRHAFTLHITSAQAQYSQYNWLRAQPLNLSV